MREQFSRLWGRLPLHFRVLYRQFLLRVVDLESLSIDADIPRFIGQFAGILIMVSLLELLGALWFPSPPALAWHIEQSRIADTLLLVGLLSVVTWDSTYPDRRDVMVLAPLPIKPRTILLAKISASSAVIGLAVLLLNSAASFGWALDFGLRSGGIAGFLRYFAAYWIAFVAAGAFLYGAILSIQGFTALLFPRRIALVLSAVLQIAAFGIFMVVYFLEPSLNTFAQFSDPANRWLVEASPVLWFFALFHQLDGSLPQQLTWVAMRAWVALSITVFAASAFLWMSYLRTMKKTVEEPDLMPGSSGLGWTNRRGGFYSAIAIFSFRSLTRSRQHRVVFAFFLSVVFALFLAFLRHEISAPAHESISLDFVMSTYLMMCFSVLGLRVVFSLPISLKANWILRITQLRPTSQYIAATRRALLLIGVLPILLASAALSLNFRPWRAVAAHLLILVLIGSLLVEGALYKLDKVPFTCSFLPGKANVQVLFWGFGFVGFILTLISAMYEQKALLDLWKYLTMAGVLVALIAGAGVINRIRARSAVLYFEELPAEIITRLGLVYVAPEEPPAGGVSMH